MSCSSTQREEKLTSVNFNIGQVFPAVHSDNPGAPPSPAANIDHQLVLPDHSLDLLEALPVKACTREEV